MLVNSRNRTVALVLGALTGFAIWYAFPGITLGERYLHRESGSNYEFRGGRFFENGEDLGSYAVHWHTLTICLDEFPSEPFSATIGWGTLSMPVPKYGQSVLHKQSAR